MDLFFVSRFVHSWRSKKRRMSCSSGRNVAQSLHTTRVEIATKLPARPAFVAAAASFRIPFAAQYRPVVQSRELLDLEGGGATMGRIYCSIKYGDGMGHTTLAGSLLEADSQVFPQVLTDSTSLEPTFLLRDHSALPWDCRGPRKVRGVSGGGIHGSSRIIPPSALEHPHSSNMNDCVL